MSEPLTPVDPEILNAVQLGDREATRLWMARISTVATLHPNTVPTAELRGVLDEMLDRVNEIERELEDGTS